MSAEPSVNSMQRIWHQGLVESCASTSAGPEGVGFEHPWEARAFAIVVKLAEAGLFSWAEWVACLGEQIRASELASANGSRERAYSEQWIDAAETLLVRKGLTSVEQLRARRLGAWPSTMDHHAPQNRPL